MSPGTYFLADRDEIYYKDLLFRPPLLEETLSVLLIHLAKIWIRTGTGKKCSSLG